MLANWQDIVDTMAELINVPAGLVMHIAGPDIRVLVASRTAGNPYKPGDSEHLFGSGLYCEAVIKNNDDLLVPNALDDAEWQDNPDVKLNMISYLGFPILWPDKAPFGTICVLDSKYNTYTASYRKLVRQFRSIIEHDLALVYADSQRALRFADDRKYQTEALLLSEERFRLLAEHAADDFFLHDDTGQLLDVNRRACDSTGYSREELLRMRITDLAPDQNGSVEAWTRTQPGDAATVYARRRRKDGTVFPVEIRLACHLIHGQKLFLEMVRDITERVAAEEAIRRLNTELERLVAERTEEWQKSTALLQAVMDGATDAIFLKDLDGRFLLFNRAAARFVNRPVADVLAGRSAKSSARKPVRRSASSNFRSCRPANPAPSRRR
ncbi:MAG: PAS domain S-box protein [Acetobacteraceae bacterium]